MNDLKESVNIVRTINFLNFSLSDVICVCIIFTGSVPFLKVMLSVYVSYSIVVSHFSK